MIHAYPHRVSKQPGLPIIDEDRQFVSETLYDLRRCERRTYRRLLQTEFNRGLRDGRESKLSMDGIVMLMRINNR